MTGVVKNKNPLHRRVQKGKLSVNSVTQNEERSNIFNEIRNNVDIVNLIADYVHLVKKGQNHIGLCPFHQERTPSFTVSQVKQFFHCFGCGAHGDAADFVSQLMNIKLIDAAKLIARDFNLSVDNRPLTAEVRQKITEVKQEVVINNNFEADMKRLYSEISLVRRCAWQCGFEALTYYCDNILDSMYDKSTEAKIAAWRLAQRIIGEVI